MYWSSFRELVVLHGASSFAQISDNFKCCCGSRSFLINAFPKVRRAVKWGKVSKQLHDIHPKAKQNFNIFQCEVYFSKLWHCNVTGVLGSNKNDWQAPKTTILKAVFGLVVVLCLQCLCWWLTITWKSALNWHFKIHEEQPMHRGKILLVEAGELRKRLCSFFENLKFQGSWHPWCATFFL